MLCYANIFVATGDGGDLSAAAGRLPASGRGVLMLAPGAAVTDVALPTPIIIIIIISIIIISSSSMNTITTMTYCCYHYCYYYYRRLCAPVCAWSARETV